MITPPNRLKAKVPRFGGASLQDIVAEAEAGMAGLADDYRTRLLATVADLKKTLGKAQGDPCALAGAAAQILPGIANMKGEAVSYGYPLVSRIAANFQAYLEQAAASEPKYAEIVAAHLGAIDVVLVGNMKDPAAGNRLIVALDELIAKALGRDAGPG